MAGIAAFSAILFLAAPASARDILVFAAASTAEAIDAAIAGYDAGKDRIRASYASSGALARQIEQGAPADLYIAANLKWVDWADRKELLDSGSIARLFGNRLVLVAPAGSRGSVKIAAGFALREALGDGRLAIGDPDHVPAGIYARAALHNLKVWESVADRTARTADVRAALALVERGEVPYGIVYRTDAILTRKVRVVDTFPEASHPPVVYTLAIVADREHSQVRRFYDFLRSPQAAKIYARFGFQPGW